MTQEQIEAAIENAGTLIEDLHTFIAMVHESQITKHKHYTSQLETLVKYQKAQAKAVKFLFDKLDESGNEVIDGDEWKSL